MDIIQINYYAVLVCGVIAMALGALWYGPLFGKKWMDLVGVDPANLKARRKMQKSAGPIYVAQFVLTLFQVLVLSHLIADTTRASGLERSLWIWAAFIIPALAGAIMWTAEEGKRKWMRFFLQGGYQLACFIIFGLIIQYWK